MAATLQTNTFTGGMNTDVSEELIQDSQYRYAENVRVITDNEGTTGVLLSIDDIYQYTTVLPEGEKVIGATIVDKYAVIFTRPNNDSNLTKVYRATGFDSSLTITCILKGYIGITGEITAVGNYETLNVVKVYFTDGNSILKVLNIVDNKYVAGSSHVDANGNIKVPSDIDIVPGANVVRPEIKGETSGNLTAGLVQYSCLLFDVHGSETNYSPLTGLFHLTQSSQANGSGLYKGTTKGDNSGKGCSIRVNNIPSNFLRCRIIRLLYTSNNETPKIEVIAELSTLGRSSIDYIDSGGIAINELTPEVFNTVSNNIFSPKAIAKKDNRLFVANILEDTWDVEYDARAYRCNSSKLVRLGNSTGSDLVYTLGSGDDNAFYRSVPKEHDCICPFNDYDYSTGSSTDKYMYSGDTVGHNSVMELGGKGLNLKYSFIVTNQEGSYHSGNTGVDMNARSKTLSSIELRRPETGTSIKTVSFPDGAVTTIDNQASPIINYYTNSYHRDEIYRFGLVFYNDRGTASPVHWIGDIRFPRTDENDNGTSSNSYCYKAFCVNAGDLEIRPIGIRFVLNNIPSGVTGVEIVRCDRTENDKTILFQAALCNTYNNSYANSATGDLGGGTDIRPYALFGTCHPTYFTSGLKVASNFLDNTATAHYSYVENDYKALVSPEISVMQDDIERVIQGKQLSLDLQYGLLSPTYGESKEGWTGRVLENVRGSINPVGTTGSANAEGFTKVADNSFYVSMSPTGSVAYVAKYYTPFSIARVNNKVNAIKYPKLIPYNEVENKSGYYTSIGSKNYLNYALMSFDGSDPYLDNYAKKHGVFGPCLISQVLDGALLNVMPHLFTVLSKEPTSKNFYDYAINGTTVVNVRLSVQPYGGSLYTSRINSVYISTGSYKSISELTSDNNSLYVFGGDTILGILDLPVDMIYLKKDANASNNGKIFLAAYIPFETSINTWLLNGDMAHFDLRLNGNYGAAYHQLLPTSMGSYFVLDKPYFVYNDAYSSQSTTAKYVPKGTYSEDNMTFRNRILCSEAKVNNEITDSWTKFKYANYLDTDNTWGLITNLNTFKDKLFFWQDSALGVASVNERSLINDGNIGSLVLGTGGILSRADYVTTSNGSSIVNDKSIVSSDNALYWYDSDKNEICSYNGLVHLLSKEKGVQSYINNLSADNRRVKSSLYDNKYNEVWMTYGDKSLIFNEQLGAYTSCYTHAPEYTLLLSNINSSIIGNKLYSRRYTDTSLAIPKVCKVSTIVNKDPASTKVFDNIMFAGEFKSHGKNKPIEALDSIVKSINFKTKTLTAEPMKPYMYNSSQSPTTKYAYDCREDNYRFAIGRSNTPNDTNSRMRGKWLQSDYTFDCSINTDGKLKSFKLPYINTTYRYSLV